MAINKGDNQVQKDRKQIFKQDVGRINNDDAVTA